MAQGVDDGRSIAASWALRLTIASVLLAMVSVGLLAAFAMDSMVTDVTERDFVASGISEGGPVYTATIGTSLPGAMAISIAEKDGDGGRSMLSIREGGRYLEKDQNVSLPFSTQYALEGRGDVRITITPAGAPSDISGLDIDVSVSGPVGILGAFTGAALSGPCCLTWTGSLIMIAAYFLISLRDRRDRRDRGWT